MNYSMPGSVEVWCGRNTRWRNRLCEILGYLADVTTSTPSRLRFFEVFAKKSEPFHPKNYISFLIKKEIPWFFDRILHHPVQGQRLRCSQIMICRSGFAIPVIFLCELSAELSGPSLRENTQMGAELIGVESIEADAEMLALVVDCLTTIGLREFQISVGNVDYFQSLIKDAGLGEESVKSRQN